MQKNANLANNCYRSDANAGPFSECFNFTRYMYHPLFLEQVQFACGYGA